MALPYPTSFERPSPQAQVRLFLGASVLFLVSALWSALTVIPSEHIALLWLPSGVFGALLLLHAKHIWWLICLALACSNILGNLVEGQSVPTAVVYTLITIIEGIVGVLIVRALLRGKSFSFSKPQHVLYFSIGSGLAASLVSATLSTIYTKGFALDYQGVHFFQHWLFGTLTGVLVAGPVTHVLVSRLRAEQDLFDVRLSEALLCLFGVAGLASLLFAGLIAEHSASVFVTMSLLPFVIWAAWRVGTFATAISVVLIGVSISLGLIFGSRGSAGVPLHPTLAIVWEQGFLIVASITTHLLAALVAERRQLGQRLIERDRFLTTLGRYLEHGLFVASAESNTFSYVSSGFERLFSFSSDELAAHPDAWQRRIAPEDRESVVQKMLNPTEPDPDGFRFRVSAADGSERWLYAHTAPVIEADGTVGVVVRIVQDVTREKEAQDALKESEERFHRFMDHSPVIAFIKDSVGRHLYTNTAFLKRFHFAASNVVGRTDAELWPGAAEQFTRNDNHVLDTGESIVVTEEIPTDKGALVFMTVKFLVRDKHGKKYIGGLALEITNEVQAREREAELRRQLEHVQRVEALGQLAGGVAHDFNNVLTVIGANADLLSRLIRDSGGRPLEERHVQNISTAVARASALTQQLLTFGRKQQVDPQLLSASEAIDDLASLVHSIVKNNIEFHTSVPSDCPSVLIDPNQLQQVLLNLALNAIDAMPHGGTLTIRASERRLDGSEGLGNDQAPAGDYVVFEVCDTGQGIPSSVRPKLFEPFFTTKPAGRGTGLGLPVAYGIVTQAHGFIRVESEEGVGTTFAVYLPAFRDATRVEESNEAVFQGSGECILVLDDEPLVRQGTAEILNAHGFTTMQAASVDEAFSIVKSNPQKFALIVSDIVMPHRTGMQFAEDLRQAFGDIPLLLMSGFSTENVHAAPHPLSDFLQKPFKTSKLLEKVQELLANAAARKSAVQLSTKSSAPVP